MSIYVYKKKTKPAPWLATPTGRATAARNVAARVKRADALERARRERRVAAGGVKPRSKRMSVAMKVYAKERAAFLKANWTCWACVHLHAVVQRSRDVHHLKGRSGPLLLDTQNWVALCRTHHDRVHADPAWARAMGLLPPMGGWNTQDNT